MLFYYNVSYFTLFKGYICGSIFYTFLEYWFHRVILHHWIFKTAHKFHHDNPIKLKIITTPLLVVQLYEICMMFVISLLFDSYTAVFIQVGVSISQIIMGFVHLYEHSVYNPWYLRVARNYHKLHHHKDNWEIGHGLTTKFWDVIFGTFPDGKHSDNSKSWDLYDKYWYIKYITIPIPLLDFIILTPLLTYTPDTLDTSKLLKINWLDFKYSKVLIALLSSIFVGFSPFLISIL
jgi:sterol desaturase/sphingolipid hydroxylase (fatty acid hydroxylase superfamily)